MVLVGCYFFGAHKEITSCFVGFWLGSDYGLVVEKQSDLFLEVLNLRGGSKRGFDVGFCFKRG